MFTELLPIITEQAVQAFGVVLMAIMAWVGRHIVQFLKKSGFAEDAKAELALREAEKRHRETLYHAIMTALYQRTNASGEIDVPLEDIFEEVRGYVLESAKDAYNQLLPPDSVLNKLIRRGAAEVAERRLGLTLPR